MDIRFIDRKDYVGSQKIGGKSVFEHVTLPER